MKGRLRTRLSRTRQLWAWASQRQEGLNPPAQTLLLESLFAALGPSARDECSVCASPAAALSDCTFSVCLVSTEFGLWLVLRNVCKVTLGVRVVE